MCRASGGQAARSRAGPLPAPAWKGGRGRGWGGRAGRPRCLPRSGGLLGGVWGGDGGAKPPVPSPPPRLALPARRSREDTQPLAALPAARREACAALRASKAPRCAPRGDRGQGTGLSGGGDAGSPQAGNKTTAPFFSETRFLGTHTLRVCYFYPPQPSGLHGDASKQQIPGGNDVTFPLPAAQASGRCRADPVARPPAPRPGPHPPPLPRPWGPPRPRAPARPPAGPWGAARPVPAGRLCWSPRGRGHGPRAALPPAPGSLPCGPPCGSCAGPRGRGGRGRPAPGLAGCGGSSPSGLGSPCRSLVGNR
ncbi:translation initiation factor IF-2-like [Leopardus geoffroyi]|uniref:translation initiation factor IF-2-like n=1 Tax=Leopardus geoffroyi TaxID=46844 RepID=UPI001E26096B|nr:translation initiation factor IF-2-like [Leopardus geoffroyi]XP_045331284.1 translation initiation factor IF-2-like [Leopardus geoffroyi]XP_045331285.1 translation initiation factor IF-2-like [Leopardus geoffroyi]